VSLDALEREEINQVGRINRGKGNGAALRLRNLSVTLHDGTAIVSTAEVAIPPGQKVLLTGDSGTGKSTLVRALAGVWPWGQGDIEIRAGAKLSLLPQRAYVPIGTVRRAINYPDPACSRSEEEIAKVLKTVGLGHLAGRLDEGGPWDRILSDGEKQRLAFARLFLQRPDIIVLDEVTAAVDSPSQDRLMELLSQELKEATVLSIGHRPELTAFHGRKLVLKRGRRGTKLVSDTATTTEQISSINCEHFFPGAMSLLPQEIRCLGAQPLSRTASAS
jgi:putative ATP-binding cassette transporter